MSRAVEAVDRKSVTLDFEPDDRSSILCTLDAKLARVLTIIVSGSFTRVDAVRSSVCTRHVSAGENCNVGLVCGATSVMEQCSEFIAIGFSLLVIRPSVRHHKARDGRDD